MECRTRAPWLSEVQDLRREKAALREELGGAFGRIAELHDSSSAVTPAPTRAAELNGMVLQGTLREASGEWSFPRETGKPRLPPGSQPSWASFLLVASDF